MMLDKKTRDTLGRVTIYGGVLVAVAGLIAASRMIPCFDDSTWLTFRFAENFVHGHGLRFNRSAYPIEAFSSPAWTALAALGARTMAPDKLQYGSLLVEGLLYVACLLLLLRQGRLAEESGGVGNAIARVLPAALWGLSGAALYSGVSGTETLLFVALVLLVHGALAGSVPRWLALIAAPLLVWTRFEGLWVLVPGALQLHFESDRDARLRRAGWPLVGVTLVSAVALAAVRQHIFHRWLPNAWIVWPPSLGAGLQGLLEAVRSPSALALLLAGAAGAVWGSGRHRGYFAAAIGWLLISFAGAGTDAGRLLQPTLVLCALASAGLGRGWDSPGRSRPLAAVTGLLFLLDLAGTALRIRSVVEIEQPRRAEEESAILWLGRSHASVIGVNDAGAFGYGNPGLEVYDFAGLVGATGIEIFFAPRAPQMTLVRLKDMPDRDSAGKLQPLPQDAVTDAEARFLADARLATRYRLLFVGKPEVDAGYAWAVYMNRGMGVMPGGVPASDVASFRNLLPKQE